MYTRSSNQAFKQPSIEGTKRSANVQTQAGQSQYNSVIQLQRTIGNKAVQQLIVGSPVIQAMPWPSKKPQQTKIMDAIAENWSDLDSSDVKSFYSWCATTEQFENIPRELSHSEWKTLSENCTGAQFDKHGFASDQSAENIRGIFKYVTAKKVTPYKSYDVGTYDQTNEELAADISKVQTEGVFDLDRIIAVNISLASDLIQADKNRHAAIWEKENNPELEQDKKTLLSQKLRAAKESIQNILALLTGEHMTKLNEEKEAAKKKAKIDGAVLAAEQSYDITGGSALTRAIWNSTKANAGLTGYLEIGGSYTVHELQTAHDEWRDFGIAYDDSDGKVDYLENIHSPGNGTAQDKWGHSNYESRSCRYQVDFISTWGGNRTVMHVGLQGTEK
ncbi:hypothetical protein [Paenibacillus planticolens]|uniref:Uncharacterized protein n=1 Tax=Paenibacillus planticolens TaxID=2654976 RepID=A0ABX1ZQ24_9BACL|nr:hypothetical protein [Paenibacillus planticolens]NOV02189.1 hypothetical protein [Paenibacillus planticolens]